MPNPFLDFLNDQPEVGYFSFQDRWRTPNLKKYFQNQFGQIQNQYMGTLGQQVRAGGAPTLSFMDFLSQFPWQQRFQEEQTQDTSRFNPFTRWIV